MTRDNTAVPRRQGAADWIRHLLVRDGLPFGHWLHEPRQQRRLVGPLVRRLSLCISIAGSEALISKWFLHSTLPQILFVFVGTAVLVLGRRRAPGSAVIGAAALSCLPFASMEPLLIVVGWSAGRWVSGARRALLVTLATLGVTVMMTYFLCPFSRLDTRFSLVAAASVAIFCGYPSFISRHWLYRRTLVSALHEHYARLPREQALLEERARLRERQRIADDMHDSVGHWLALITLQCDALRMDKSLPEAIQEEAETLRHSSSSALEELREAVGVLGRATRDDAHAQEAAPAVRADIRFIDGIDELADTSRRAGATVEVTHIGERCPIAATVGHTAYRIVQEGLTNAHKHAPGAKILVEVRYEPDALVVVLTNGPALRPCLSGSAVGGRGLAGLNERARLIGGHVYARPAPDSGFRLAGLLPYRVTPPRRPQQRTSMPETERPSGVPSEKSEGCSWPWRAPVGDESYLWPELSSDASQRDLVRALRGTQRAVGAVVVIGFAVVAAMMAMLNFALDDQKAMSTTSAQVYQAAQLGQTEAEIRLHQAFGHSAAAQAARARALGSGALPAEPVRAYCKTFVDEQPGFAWEPLPVYRFCFTDGRLSGKWRAKIRL
ncbi:sensor histidine kinase [Streptomyces lasiicapitis]|uniref:sensor histidine kinase n=1 Tax=Streptomyces lasiicapitis TaxID=1923961 RepID=UPI0036B25305